MVVFSLGFLQHQPTNKTPLPKKEKNETDPCLDLNTQPSCQSRERVCHFIQANHLPLAARASAPTDAWIFK